MQERYLSIRTTDAIFRNIIFKYSKIVMFEFHMQKIEILKLLMSLVCETEKGRTVCKLCLMLMHAFGRVSVEWHKLTMDVLAYRGVLAPNFVEKISLILL